ncbi:MAG TPA: M56 family metallopeptidase [Caulobacteraceae bacterium]|nr:M56 family metallopeptidase [Caulobacteraceae bacterium]
MTAADVLEALSRMNLAAGAAILGVVALRKLVRTRFGARLAYGLWLLPVLTSAAVLIPARQVHVVRAATPAMVTAFGAQQGVLAPPAPTAVSLDPLVLIVGVWIAGIAVAALIMAGLQLRFMRQARGGALGPALVGVMAPRIVTPKDFAERYSPGEQTLVLAHERTHLERQDSRLNGFCAALQCLCWFNPLVHLGAHLMRIDQELACDEAVVIRFPGARRAYAEVLVKAQLATLPLPLGCYWPSKSAHPLVERIAMLKRKDLGRASRRAGLAGLVALCCGAGFAAWASQPPEVRITVGSPAGEAQLAAASQAPVIASSPEKPRASHHPVGRGPAAGVVAPRTQGSAAGQESRSQIPADAAAPADKVTLSAAALTVAPTQPLSVTPPQEIVATVFSAPQPTPASSDASAGLRALPPLAARPAPPARQPPASADTGSSEANCYPVFGDLHCERLHASPTSTLSNAIANRPAMIVAAASSPSPGVTSAVSPAPAMHPIRVSAAFATAAASNPDKMLCQDRVVTGSHFVRHICMTLAQWEDQPLRTYAFKRRVLIEPDGYLQYFY